MNDTRPEPRIEEIVHVSTDLREDGGEQARFARVLALALRACADRLGLRFRGLHLASSEPSPALEEVRSFGGGRRAFGVAIAGLQLRGAGRRLLVFDSLEVFRIQARIPAPLRSRSVVWVAGAENEKLGTGLRRALSKATRVLTFSQAARARAGAWLPQECHVTVVHPGIEREPLPGEQRIGIIERAGRDFVLAVSTERGRQGASGQMELLAAWPGLIDYLPGIWLAVVCDDDDRPPLERRAKQLGLGRLVRFLGPVDAPSLAELHRRAIAFALASAEVGLGLGLLEAMRAATPCVGLEGTASAEIVVDGYTGILVAPGDRIALSRGLAQLLADRERARRMGVAGRSRFLHDFTSEAFEKRLDGVLERAIEGQPEPSSVAAPSPERYREKERLALEIESGLPTPEPGSLRLPARETATGSTSLSPEATEFKTPTVAIDLAMALDPEPSELESTELPTPPVPIELGSPSEPEDSEPPPASAGPGADETPEEPAGSGSERGDSEPPPDSSGGR